MITLPLLDHDPGIRHAFFTREGGVSGGFFESLNCGFGSGDAAEMVARNRAIAMERLGFSPDKELQLKALRQLSRNSVTEIVLGLTIFAIVGVLGTLHPAIHLM